MADEEQGQIPQRAVGDPISDVPDAKMWVVYLSEAEKYDKALVESWKGDMDGLLIFAGLFSAILTAFIVESYKTLNPDPSETTVHLLAQISQQLAGSANGTTVQLPPAAELIPSTASLFCNILWFISLGFSLSCALIATLIQQWAREFLHKANMRSAPVTRARIFSYLYEGIKDFQMHTVVEIIPWLIHASLFLFFGGLVAFLLPLNIPMAIVSAAILFIVAAIYAVLTFLPLRHLNCPYRTPLSGAFWRVSQCVRAICCRRNARDHAEGYSMVKAMFHTAEEESAERNIRDRKALKWTMGSLVDNSELEPFVEAIPGALCDLRTLNAYEGHISHLISDPEVKLLKRLVALFESCNTGLLSATAAKRRRIISYKALWAISSRAVKPLDPPAQGPASETISHQDYCALLSRNLYKNDFMHDPELASYARSAMAMMQSSTFCTIESDLLQHRHSLNTQPNVSPRLLSTVREFVNKVYWKFVSLGFDALSGEVKNKNPSPADLMASIDELLHIPFDIFLEYFPQYAVMDPPPYRWNETRTVISQRHPFQHIDYQRKRVKVEVQLNAVVSKQLDKLNARATNQRGETPQINHIIIRLLSFWQPDTPCRIPPSIILFLSRRTSNAGLLIVLANAGSTEHKLWSSFPITLLDGPGDSTANFSPPLERKDLFAALWTLAALDLSINYHYEPPPPQLLETVLAVMLNTEEPSATGISTSIVAVLKCRILADLSFDYRTTGDQLISFKHHLLPGMTAIPFPDGVGGTDRISSQQSPILTACMKNRKTEAAINILAEFVEHCDSDVLPHRAVETLKRINGINFHDRSKLAFRNPFAPRAPVHPGHQIRLANSIHRVFTVAQPCDDLLNEVVNSQFWNMYSNLAPHRSDREMEAYPWLEEPIARGKVVDVFRGHEAKLAASHQSPHILIRLRNILQGLESSHPGTGAMHSNEE
ncbi:hypothetical protein C8J57DRAFT_182292 [Mycena rebaudengoi]|nr:hypothetical protein C8J57DRAFT_182292 [Mycena rebaudengoi]